MDQQGILATAYNEYMEQMNELLLPFLIATFDEMYERAKVDSKGKNTLIRVPVMAMMAKPISCAPFRAAS